MARDDGGVMRVLRSSQYVGMYDPPLTAVVRDCDVTDTLESVHHGAKVPGSLVVSEILEMDDDTDIATASMLAIAAFVPERQHYERQMAIAYHWNADWLGRIRKGGVMFNDKPAPITAADYPDVLEQLAQHPNYDGQIVIVITSDGRKLRMHDGKVRDMTN